MAYIMKNPFIALSTILIFSLLQTLPAFSAPNITNVSDKKIRHNQTVTITGHDFGAKTGGHTPIRFDTFESGEAGESIAGGWWKIKGNHHDITYNDGIPARHGFSRKQVRWKKTKKTNEAGRLHEWFYKDKVGFAKTGRAYLNLWLNIDFIEVSSSALGTWWLYLIDLLPDSARNPSLSLSFWTRDDTSVTWVRNIAIDSQGNKKHLKGDNFLPIENYWMNIAIEYKESDVGGKNGEATIFNSQTPFYSGRYGKRIIKNYLTRASGDDKFVNAIRLGQYVTSSPNYSIETYWDDIYVDNSWARVEIGDRHVYDKCTHREIQLPTDWSNNSITITVNQGSFAKTNKVYLFVVDENGIPGKGYLIKFIDPTSGSRE